jgi:predicted SprT family Zn-dependent metalloprotease
MLLAKGVKILLKKMETILENDYAFINVVVRFWETYRCQACKQHEIKIRRH